MHPSLRATKPSIGAPRWPSIAAPCDPHPPTHPPTDHPPKTHQTLPWVPQATCYLNKMPPSFSPQDRILVSDPMLATGGASGSRQLGSAAAVTLGCCGKQARLAGGVFYIWQAMSGCRGHAGASTGRHCAARRCPGDDPRYQVRSVYRGAVCHGAWRLGWRGASCKFFWVATLPALSPAARPSEAWLPARC